MYCFKQIFFLYVHFQSFYCLVFVLISWRSMIPLTDWKHPVISTSLHPVLFCFFISLSCLQKSQFQHLNTILSARNNAPTVITEPLQEQWGLRCSLGVQISLKKPVVKKTVLYSFPIKGKWKQHPGLWNLAQTNALRRAAPTVLLCSTCKRNYVFMQRALRSFLAICKTEVLFLEHITERHHTSLLILGSSLCHYFYHFFQLYLTQLNFIWKAH